MIESVLVPRLLRGLGEDPSNTRALEAFVGILEESRLSGALVLWAWDVLGTVQLAPGEKPRAMVFLLGPLLAEARGHTVLGFDAPELAELARALGGASAGRPVSRLIDDLRHWMKNGTLASLFGDAPDMPLQGPGSILEAPVSVTRDGLQFSRTRWMEQECARLFRSRLEAPAPPEQGPDPLADYPGPLDDDQRAMIRGALGRRVCWISGGPGTGKTTCIHGLLWAIGRRAPAPDPGRIALAAPTGKAAFRVTEGLRRLAGARERTPAGATGPFDEAILSGRLEARTLHRLLEYRPDQDRFGRHEGTPLDVDWVIVDESSMVDLSLCHALLRALPESARLAWIGDRDQLPAVGRGAVFQACWEEGPLRRPENYFHLSRNYRARLGLAADVRSLMAGTPPPWESPAAAFPAEDRLVAHRVETGRDRQELMDALFADTYDDAFWEEALQTVEWDLAQVTCAPGSHPDHASIVRRWSRANGSPVLCATHGGPRGTIVVNEHFRQRHPWAAQGWLPGEPVMVQANDYQRDLWNGDTGVVLLTTWRGVRTTCAAFRQGESLRIFPIDGLQVARAYAFSVHKSQGSEYDEVTLLLPESPSPILTRELVYTAVTRGRSCVRLAGAPEVLAAALGARLNRRMNLGRWLFGD